jgi:hypothetical protein
MPPMRRERPVLGKETHRGESCAKARGAAFVPQPDFHETVIYTII